MCCRLRSINMMETQPSTRQQNLRELPLMLINSSENMKQKEYLTLVTVFSNLNLFKPDFMGTRLIYPIKKEKTCV